MDVHELPKWHSTFSANADVATSTVHARGELDLLTVDLLWGTIDVLLRGGHYHVTLGLAEVSGIDAAGDRGSVQLWWPAEHGREDEARDVLQRLRSHDPDADAELEDIRRASEEERGTHVRDLLTPQIRPLLLVGIGLAVFQQFGGINTFIYYASTILSDTGLSASSSITQTVFIGVTNMVFTTVAVLLLDRLGRRRLLLTARWDAPCR